MTKRASQEARPEVVEVETPSSPVAGFSEKIPPSIRSVIFAVTSLAVVFGLLASQHAAHTPSLIIWPVLIGAAALLAESFPIHILYRREATSFSLFEVPLVVGVVLLSGWELLAAVAVGVTAALMLVRKQPLAKVLFNLPNLLLHASVTTLTFDLLAPGPGFGPGVVAAAVVAALIGSVLASSMIALVIRAAEGALDFRKTVDMLAFSALVGVTNASLAMMAMKLGSVEPWSVVLLAGPLAVATAAYRAFVSERHQREQLQFLLAATKSLTADLGRFDAFEALLTETAAMFRASRVELIIFDNVDAVEAPVQCSLTADGLTIVELDDVDVFLRPAVNGLLAPLLLPTASATGQLGRWLNDLEVDQVLVAPLRSDTEDIGLFVVADRVGAASSFASADLELFATLSFQVGTALENNRLGQALAELKKLEGELSHLAVHDILTGLPNRLGLSRHLEEATEDTAVDLLFVDLDDFKIVNDTFGHGSGDELLVEVANRISGCLREADFAARLGGDEFAICVPDVGAGALIADRIVQATAEPIQLGGNTVSVGCSIGIASCDPTMDVPTMLRRADVAMYSAKSAGKNRARSYTDRLDEELQERQRVLRELQSAVANNEFQVHYQPIFDFDGVDGSPVGAEALVRWVTKDGLRAPGDFLPIAEESHLIVEIDRWVYRYVMADAELRPDLNWISVNLSARHVQEDDVVDWLVATTKAAGIDPSRIILEITETAVMADIESSIEKLAMLRKSGFGLALDDFGTGHSSIAYLRRLPISILKVAQPFIVDLHSSGDPTFVQAIIDLSHTLGLPVIAEGVETLEQLSSLRSMGCDLAQGYLLGRPAPLAELAGKPPLLPEQLNQL